MTEKSPAFQFYPKDLLADPIAMGLGNELLGAYLKLLCFDWMEDGLPDDDPLLLELTNLNQNPNQDAIGGPDRRLVAIRRKFEKHPTKEGFISNPRLQKERVRQAEHRERSSRGGKQSAKQKTTKSQPEGQAKPNTPSSSPSPSSNTLKPMSGKPDRIKVINYLNEKLGKDYKLTDNHDKIIGARFKEGYTLPDFKKVIDGRISEWLNDAKMARFLRPITLFGTKFDSYLNPVKANGTGGNGSKYDGIQPERDLAKDELKAKICEQMEFVKSEVTEGKCDFGELGASTWLHMAVGKHITEFEQRFGENPLNEKQSEFYQSLRDEYIKLEQP